MARFLEMQKGLDYIKTLLEPTVPQDVLSPKEVADLKEKNKIIYEAVTNLYDTLSVRSVEKNQSLRKNLSNFRSLTAEELKALKEDVAEAMPRDSDFDTLVEALAEQNILEYVTAIDIYYTFFHLKFFKDAVTQLTIFVQISEALLRKEQKILHGNVNN